MGAPEKGSATELALLLIHLVPPRVGSNRRRPRHADDHHRRREAPVAAAHAPSWAHTAGLLEDIYR